MFILKEPSGIQLIQPLKDIFPKERIPIVPAAQKAENQKNATFPEDQGRYVKVVEAYGQTSNKQQTPKRITFATEIMSKPVKTIPQNMPLSGVWNFFTENDLRHAVVVDHKGELMGVLSERDLLRAEQPSRQPAPLSLDAPVSQIMKTGVTCCRLNTEIRHIALVMFDKRIGIMPVLDEQNRLEGVITRSNILKALVHFAPINMWM